MILGLLEEKLPEQDILTVKPAGTLKAIGMGIMRAEADIGAAATATLTGLASYISPELAEPLYRFHEEVVKPAKKYWTPEPGSVSGAGEFLSGVAGIAPYLLLGPEVLISTSMMNIADELSEQGVDKKAIIESAIIRGLSTAAMTKIPPAGKTLGKTFGLAAINPAFGMAERKAIQEILKAEGYKDLAGQYDPLDPYAMGIDAFMGAMFGGYSHLLKASAKRLARRTFETEKAKAIEDITQKIESPVYHELLKKMPVEVEDAIGVLRQYQKTIKDTMFDPENPRAIRMHFDALNKALNDLAQDKQVDVTEQVREIQRPYRTYETYGTYTIDNLRGYLSDVGISEEQVSAYEGLLRANAKIAGEDFDVYVSKRIAGVERVEEVPEGALYQTSEENLKQIHARKTKGAVEFLEDGRAVIHAFEGFDFSTLVHETAHIFRRHLPEGDLRILESQYGIKDGKWSREHDENFAKGLERYFAEGKAPEPELQGVFDKFKKWILEIYRNIVGDDVWNVKLSPEIRKIMDRLFIEAEIPLKKLDLPETIEARRIVEAEGKELEAEVQRQAKENGFHIDIREFAEKAGKPLTLEIHRKTTEAERKDFEAQRKEAEGKQPKPLSVEEGIKYLKENPFLADYVLENQSLYPKEVVAEAGKIKSAYSVQRIAENTQDAERTTQYDDTYDIKHHVEWLRSYIGESEGPSKVYNPETGEVVGRLGSGYPLWFQNKGYTKKEVMNIALKFMGGKKLTEKQQGILDDLIKSSKTEYGMMYVTDMPEARMVEEIMAEKGDIPSIETYTAEGEPVLGGMKKSLDKAKVDLKKTAGLQRAYEMISKCVR